MDRRISETKLQLQKLKNECQCTVELLNKLLDTCSSQVNTLDTIDPKNFRSQSQYFLAITQFQLQTYKKVLQINIDLEDHIEQQELPKLELHSKENTEVPVFAREDVSKHGASIITLNTDNVDSCKQYTQLQCLELGHKTESTTFKCDQEVVPVLQKPKTQLQVDTLQMNYGKPTNLSKINTEVKDVSCKELSQKSQLQCLELGHKTESATFKCDQEVVPVLQKPKAQLQVDTLQMNYDRPTNLSKTNTEVKEVSCKELNQKSFQGEGFLQNIPKELVPRKKRHSEVKELPSLDLSNTKQILIPLQKDVPKQKAALKEPNLQPAGSSTDKKHKESNILQSGKSSMPVQEEKQQESMLKQYNQINPAATLKCIDQSKKGNSEQQPKVFYSKEKAKKMSPSAPVNIVETLKELSERRTKKKLDVEPMPGISLQPSTKKMSAVIKETVVKTEFRSLTDVDSVSSEEDFPVSEKPSNSVMFIKDRVEPKVGDICMIGHIKSPSHFYIQVADGCSYMLDMLPIQLEFLSSRKFSYLTKHDAKKNLGNFCCIKIDGLWYRIEVLDWMLDATDLQQDLISLQLIDYGNIIDANYKELCPLLKEFSNFPKMAQLCQLDSIYPCGSTQKKILTEWSEESIDGFLNICGDINANIFKITHVSKDVDEHSFAIELINTSESDDSNSVGQILLDAHLAIEIHNEAIMGNTTIINQIIKSHGLQNIKQNMTRDEILEMYFAQNNVEEARNINEAVMGYNPRDEAETCRNQRSDGTCFKGNQCKLRHVPLKDGFTRDKHPVYNSAFVNTAMPSSGDEILLTISHVCDIQRFYAQIRIPHNRDCERPTINALITDMNKPETIKLFKPLQYPPGLSELVIVKHWNSHWYRGQVRNINLPEVGDNAMVEVWVVDFGDTLIVPMSELRMIVPEFLLIPFQAIECRLYNVRHKFEADEAEEKKYFESRYLGQTFRATVIAAPGHLEVLMFTKENEDLGEKLIADGYGAKNTEHNFPKENEYYLID